MIEQNQKLKEQADTLMKIKGHTKGSEILTTRNYIQAIYGEEGVRKLEKKMAEIGYPVVFDEIRPAHWYQESLNVLINIVAKSLFGWQDLYELGYNSPVFSFGVRVFIKYLPLSLFVREVPKAWRKFLDVGSLEVSEFNKKKKYVILSLKDYNFHREMCRYFEGFFLRLAEYFIKSEEITIEEIECSYKGGSAHKFKIKWI